MPLRPFRTSALCLLLVALGGCPDPLEAPIARISDAPSDEPCDRSVEQVRTSVLTPAPVFAHCSHDPNGLTLTYRWALVDQPSGSELMLPNDTVMSPTVVPDLAGTYRLSLVVSNGVLTSRPAFVSIAAD
jgi:hypothetical protein